MTTELARGGASFLWRGTRRRSAGGGGEAGRAGASPGRAKDPGFSRLAYSFGRGIGLFIFFQTMRTFVIRPELAERPGGYVLALTHLGNLDPFLSGVLIRRPMRWMTRKEFFKYRPVAWLLRQIGCFSVNR